MTQNLGDWGPPSLFIPPDVTGENFRQWMILEFVPEEGSPSGLDFCLKMYVIVAEVDGEMLIGYLEPAES